MKIRHLSPSAAHRWFNCAGSVRAEMAAPIVETDNQFALEGTAGHKLFELALRKKVEAEVYVGETIRLSQDKVDWEVTEDMAEHIQDGIDMVRRRAGKGQLWYESPTMLKFPFVAIDGTLDAGWFGRYKIDDVTKGPKQNIGAFENQLHVLDLKYGQGVLVEAHDNKQLFIYGLARLRELEKRGKNVDSIHLWIYQPRIDTDDGTTFRHVRLEPIDLFEFEQDLEKAARAATKPVAPRKAGSWCLYCRAHAVCPVAEQAILRTMKAKFSRDDQDRIGELKFIIPWARKWAADIDNLAKTMGETGRPPTGWKVVRGNKWKKFPGNDVDHLKKIAPKIVKLGVKLDDIAPRKLLSVSKITKLVPEKKKPQFEKLYVEGNQKNRLVPVDSKRAAVTANMFFEEYEDDGQL